MGCCLIRNARHRLLPRPLSVCCCLCVFFLLLPVLPLLLSDCHHGCVQGVSTSRSQGVSESDSDVKYPTLHKPAQKGSKAAATVAAADPDSPEVQYPGIYKPNKKKIDSGTVSAVTSVDQLCMRFLLLDRDKQLAVRFRPAAGTHLKHRNIRQVQLLSATQAACTPEHPTPKCSTRSGKDANTAPGIIWPKLLRAKRSCCCCR